MLRYQFYTKNFVHKVTLRDSDNQPWNMVSYIPTPFFFSSMFIRSESNGPKINLHHWNSYKTQSEQIDFFGLRLLQLGNLAKIRLPLVNFLRVRSSFGNQQWITNIFRLYNPFHFSLSSWVWMKTGFNLVIVLLPFSFLMSFLPTYLVRAVTIDKYVY